MTASPLLAESAPSCHYFRRIPSESISANVGGHLIYRLVGAGLVVPTSSRCLEPVVGQWSSPKLVAVM